MSLENDDDFYKLTFSQREGKASLPEPMLLEHIPRRFRQLAWRVIDGEIRDSSDFDLDDPNFLTEPNIGTILCSYEFDVLDKYHDEIAGYDAGSAFHFFRKLISYENYHDVLTCIEFILRHEFCSESLRKGLIDAFDKAPIAYFVGEKNGRPTIMPRFSRESGEATQRAIETICESGMEGATTHLRQAAEHINTQQYGDSIADSIHAVESVACKIDPRASKTLGPALDSLERAKLLNHPALKEAFKKLYGYTSDEQGIRHALLDKGVPDVDVDEAVFMFAACASFAAYLVCKHRQTNQQQDNAQ